ncbi:MAG: LysE family transporter [Planctomycetes bacterium]|nr:LysE family transporter [Planctomycetota bacterium]
MPGISNLLAQQSPISYEGWLLFFKGTWVGLAITAPPGPVGGLAVRRTARDGLVAGLSTALGALLADVTLGAFAMLPASQFHGFGHPWDQVIAVVAALVLVLLGVKYFRRALHGQVFDEAAPETKKGPGIIGVTVGTFALTLMTPATIPSFILFFTQLKLGQGAEEMQFGPVVVIGGVAAGAAAWWLALCGVVYRFRAHARSWMRVLEFVCAGLMFVGAAFALWKGLIASHA